MGRISLVARSYADIIRRLGVRKDACGAGRVALVATTAQPGADALASLSELAICAAYLSVRRDEQAPLSVRIGLIIARRVWNGDVTAMARATRLHGRGWLLECELRDARQRLLSTAYAYAADV